MNHQILWLSSAKLGSCKLACYHWKNAYGTALPVRGYVWIVHGMGEHAGRYDEVANFLVQFGFDVLAIDLPGHGLSARDGKFTRLATVDESVDILAHAQSLWLESIAKSLPTANAQPWFLLGHSMGGLLGLSWLLKLDTGFREFARRAFISAPSLAVRLAVPAWKTAAVRFLIDTAPNLKISTGLKAEFVSGDACVVAAYKEDPLVHGKSSPAQYLSILGAADKVRAAAKSIDIPLCLAVGLDDPIIDPNTVRSFFESLGTHKRLLEFPGFKHEILNEVGRKAVYRAVAEWFV